MSMPCKQCKSTVLPQFLLATLRGVAGLAGKVLWAPPHLPGVATERAEE